MKNNNSEKKWQQLVTALADGVIVTHQDGTILYANDQAAQLFGRSSQELIGLNFTYPLACDNIQEIDIIRPDGQVITAEMIVKIGAWAEQSAWIISLRDISEKKHKMDQLELASYVFKYAHEGIMITDLDYNLVEVNQAMIDMTGYSRTELIGQNPRILKSGHHDVTFYETMYSCLKEKGYWKGEIWEQHKKGTLFPVHLAITSVKNQDNQIINFIGFCYDLALLKKQEDLITRMKLYDPLTNLPNQYYLSETLNSLMNNTQGANFRLIVAYISIDGIHSEKNSKILTEEGKDLLLVAVTHRLLSILDKDIFLARISHSDFVAVFKLTGSTKKIIPLIQKLSVEIALPYKLYKKTNVYLTSSIGITSYPQDLVVFPEELLRQSHLAAYEARFSSENQYKFFDRPMEIQKIKYNQQIKELKTAVSKNQLQLFYQPKINLQTGEIIGAEALLRFHHPIKGLLSPLVFLPSVVNHPISIEIGEWVIEQVLKQLEQWRLSNISIPISINISPYHLQQKNFLVRFREIIAKYPNVGGDLIQLEILETEVLEKIADAKVLIHECKKMGVLFALDDFGTGYSSLTYLKELPASWVKLDQTFVRDIINKPENISILKACIQMCKLLNRKVIAEGLETIQHGKLLMYLGCVYGQGYVISCPISGEHFPDWINNWTPYSEWNLDVAHIKEGKNLIKIFIDYHSKIDSIKQLMIKGDPLSSIALLSKHALINWIEQKEQSSLELNLKAIKQTKLLQKKIALKIEEIDVLCRLGSQPLALSYIEQLEALSSSLLDRLLLLI